MSRQSYEGLHDYQKACCVHTHMSTLLSKKAVCSTGQTYKYYMQWYYSNTFHYEIDRVGWIKLDRDRCSWPSPLTSAVGLHTCTHMHLYGVHFVCVVGPENISFACI